MSDEFDLDRLASLSEEVADAVTAVKRAIVEGADGVELFELAQDLWEVLGETRELLETIDLTEVPDAIDFEDLPDAVEVDDVPEGLLDEDEGAIELTNVREAVNLRELWEAVDLTQLVQEKRELDAAVDDVTDDEDDDDGLIGDDDDDGWLDDEEDEEDDELFQNVVDTGDGAKMQFESEARQAYIEEKILDAVEKFRAALLTAHEKLRKLYHANQEKLGDPGRQPDSLNPTAASTMPPGPIPDSVSARTSTVPSQVRYSRVENPRRIYGRRFEEETDLGSRFDSDGADESSTDEDADAEASDEGGEETADDREDGGDSSEEGDDASDGSADGAQDDADTIEIGVYEGDD